MRLLLGTLIVCVFASTPVLSEDVYQCQDKRSGAVSWNEPQSGGASGSPAVLTAFVMKVISDTKWDVIKPRSTKHLTCRLDPANDGMVPGFATICSSINGFFGEAWAFQIDDYGTIHYNYAGVVIPSVWLPPDEYSGGLTVVRYGRCRKLKL